MFHPVVRLETAAFAAHAKYAQSAETAGALSKGLGATTPFQARLAHWSSAYDPHTDPHTELAVAA